MNKKIFYKKEVHFIFSLLSYFPNFPFLFMYTPMAIRSTLGKNLIPLICGGA